MPPPPGLSVRQHDNNRIFSLRCHFQCRPSDMAAQCVTKVELTVSCDHLLDRDIGSKSDPLCVLLMNTTDSQWFEVSSG